MNQLPMNRTPQQRRLRILAILFAAAPPAFALIRALNARSDLRMLWMALTSLVGVSIVMAMGDVRRRERRGVLSQSAIALVVATLLAGWTAIRLGATAAAGIWPVSFVLAFCWVASFALDALSRPRTG